MGHIASVSLEFGGRRSTVGNSITTDAAALAMLVGKGKAEGDHSCSGPKWCEGYDLSWILEQLSMTTAHPGEQYMCMIM